VDIVGRDFDYSDTRQIENVVGVNRARPKLNHHADGEPVQSESAWRARADKTNTDDYNDGPQEERGDAQKRAKSQYDAER
jgi:hypothetical protein